MEISFTKLFKSIIKVKRPHILCPLYFACLQAVSGMLMPLLYFGKPGKEEGVVFF
jgi:hypothetical protein